MTRRTINLCFAILLCMATQSIAIDNPDAPDYVAEFNQRARSYEDVIQKQAMTTQDYLKAYADYEQFLDKELNLAYRSLSMHLGSEQMSRLKESQLKWIKYRDAEFAFIAANWTTEGHGSSAVLSRGGYRTSIIRDRVIFLLEYLKNYR